MALVAHFDLELYQMDIKTAFRNGDIDEIMYLVQPEESKKLKEYGLQIKEIHLWPQASFLSMVSQILSSHYLVWFWGKFGR